MMSATQNDDIFDGQVELSQKRQRQASKCSVCGMTGHTKRTHDKHQISIQEAAQSATPWELVSAQITNTFNQSSSSSQNQAVIEEETNDNYEFDDGEQVLDAIDIEVDEPNDGNQYIWVQNDVEIFPRINCRNTEAVIKRTTPLFSGPQMGPNIRAMPQISRCLRKLDYFMLFWTQDVLNDFITTTNKYGYLYVTQWKLLTIAEFKAFLGIIMYLGIVQYPTREMAFEKSDFGSPFLSKLMNFKRFSDILKAWHYTDYTDLAPEQFQDIKKAEPFWAVKDLALFLSSRYQLAWNCGQPLSIDEQTVPSKHRHKCRCFNPNKPWKFHFKIFSLNCTMTGYQSNFYLYEGAAENRPNDIPATLFPFTKLLNNDQYKDKKHILATDNWFTSIPALKYVVNEIGAHFVGTCRVNKQGIPENGIFKKTGAGKKARGQMNEMETDISSTKQMYFVSWMDNKPVHFLSTLKSYNVKCMRNSEDNQKKWCTKEYDMPSVAVHYNKTMGGTDLDDGRLSQFRPKIKTISWIPRLFIHFLNSSMVNSYIVYKYHTGQDSRYTLLEYVKELCYDLCNELLQDIHEIGPSHMQYHTKKAWQRTSSRRHGMHIPYELSYEHTEKNGKSRNTKRGHCLMCGKNVATMCKNCNNVHLCLLQHDNYMSCWEWFHTKEIIIGARPNV